MTTTAPPPDPGQDTTKPWIPADTFSHRLALVRAAMHWNRTQAGEACGLNSESWRQWEQGVAAPRHQAQVVARICRATGVSREWLMWGGDLSHDNELFASLTNVTSSYADAPFDDAASW